MLVPSVLLLVIGSLGAFDIAWFHTYKGRLVEKAECRSEVVLHVIRGVVYAVQFVVVPVPMRGSGLPTGRASSSDAWPMTMRSKRWSQLG